jgi:hypothetical protein
VKDETGGACTNGGEKEHVYVEGKARRKEATKKTKT